MAFTPLIINGAAGNASDVALHTTAATVAQWDLIENVTAYNSTAGSLGLTIKILESDGTKSTLIVNTVAAGSTASYGKESVNAICPIAMNPGNQFIANASGVGISLRASGLSFS